MTPALIGAGGVTDVAPCGRASTNSTALSIEHIVDWAEQNAGKKPVGECFNESNDHSRQCPTETGKELEPYLMQGAVGKDQHRCQAGDICNHEKCPEAEAQPQGPERIRSANHGFAHFC